VRTARRLQRRALLFLGSRPYLALGYEALSPRWEGGDEGGVPFEGCGEEGLYGPLPVPARHPG